MFGDIATNLAAVPQGGQGMAASGNVGDEHAMFEPIYSSAPRHAGKNVVNPTAMILATQMMLKWLGRKKHQMLLESAVVVKRAVEAVLRRVKVLIYDFGESAKCCEAGSAAAAAMATLGKNRL
jgi:3-isopropylmalate dehydrogenase